MFLAYTINTYKNVTLDKIQGLSMAFLCYLQ